MANEEDLPELEIYRQEHLAFGLLARRLERVAQTANFVSIYRAGTMKLYDSENYAVFDVGECTWIGLLAAVGELYAVRQQRDIAEMAILATEREGLPRPEWTVEH